MEQVEKQAERRHGGYRPGAGRKSKYGAKTVVMRIPEIRVREVQKLLTGAHVESVTESKAEPIEDIRRIVERWRVTGSERAKIYSSAFDAKSRRRRDVGGPLGWGSSGVFHA